MAPYAERGAEPQPPDTTLRRSRGVANLPLQPQTQGAAAVGSGEKLASRSATCREALSMFGDLLMPTAETGPGNFAFCRVRRLGRLGLVAGFWVGNSNKAPRSTLATDRHKKWFFGIHVRLDA